MILTKELLHIGQACVEGYRFGLSQNIIGLEYEEAIRKCRELNHDDFADYLESRKTSWVMVEGTGGVSTGRYFVRSVDSDDLKDFSSFDAAVAALDVYKSKFMSSRSDMFVANYVEHTESGGEIWHPCDLATTEHIDNFAVFDPLTGVYESGLSLTDARVKAEQVKQNYMTTNAQLFTIFEELKNPDGWVALKPVQQ